MSARARCLRPEQLLALGWGLAGEDGERPGASERHLAGCMTCRAAADEVRRALERGRDRAAWTGAQAVWPALRERLAAPEPRALPVHLRCTWCHDALVTGEAVHCAACLAPHHEDCFAAQRGCAAAGCGEERLLRPERVSRPRRVLLAATVLLAGGLALAGAGLLLRASTARGRAEAPSAVTPRAAQTTPTAPPPLPSAAWVTRRHDVAGLLLHPLGPARPSEASLQAALLRPVSLRCWETPLPRAVTGLCASAGAGLWIDPRVDPRRLVTARLRDLPLGEALRQVLAPQGLICRPGEACLRIEPQSPPAVPAGWEHPPVRPWHPARLAPEALLEGARAAIGQAVGAAAWDGPAELRLEGTCLTLVHSPRAQAALADWLAARRGASPGPGARWFVGAADPGQDPGLSAALALRARLRDRALALDLEGVTVRSALKVLNELGLPVRLEPGTSARPVCEGLVWLGAQQASTWEVLDLLCEGRGLVWDLEPDGVWVRAVDRPAREERLQAAVAAALDEGPAGRELRARLHGLEVEVDARARPLADMLDDLAGLGEFALVVDPALELAFCGRIDLLGRRRPLDEVLDELLAAQGLAWVGRGAAVHVLGPVPRLSAAQRDLVEGLLEAPLAPGGEAVLDLGGLWARLERSVHPGLRVWATPALRAARVRCALPGGIRVRDALELARRQAGVRAVWARLEGEVVLALALDPQGPPLRRWAARLMTSAPETWLQGALVEVIAARSELDDALNALDPDELALAAWQERLGVCERAAARLDEVEDGIGWLAGRRVEDARLRARVNALLVACLTPERLSARENGRLGDLLRARVVVAVPPAIVERLTHGETWAGAFPDGWRGVREDARREAVRRLGVGLDRLARCGIEWAAASGDGPTIARVRDGSPAGQAWLERGDVIVSAGGRPCPDLVELLDALCAAEGARIGLRVRRDSRTRDVQLQLSPR